MRSVTKIQNDERLWTVKDVAHYLSKGKSWIYEQAGSGKLPSIRVGAELRFEPETIKRLFRGELQPAKVLSLAKK